MQIKEIKDQIRNDIFAIGQCEHCGNEQKITGYDDDNWWNNVLPSRKCTACGESTNSKQQAA